jgi:hypothetical protein
MSVRRVLSLLIAGAALCSAQLTLDQRIADFQYMAAVYAKRYGPYEWKRDAIGFDLLNIAPWLDKVRATRTDLEFYDVASEYVSSLNDAHDGYNLPSNFVARLNFTVDVFEGKLLVDSVNRLRLPADEFGFVIGYELVSIDGADAQKLVDGLLRYDIAANPRSTRRFAAGLLTFRPQQLIPSAPAVPEISAIVFRRPDGILETYRIPWAKSGVPLTSVGRYTTPRSAIALRPVQPSTDDSETDVDSPVEEPDYTRVLQRLQNCRIPGADLVGFESVNPVFAASLPSSFVQRLGRTANDPFYSGVFEASGKKVGFLRIPTFAPPIGSAAAASAFEKEIAYFQTNTDGLIIDVMRNGGGNGSYTNQLLSLVMPSKWRSIAFEVRATSDWVASFSSGLEAAKAQGAPQNIIDLMQGIKDELVAANGALHGRTKPIPVDDVTIDRDPATDAKGSVIAYTKPIMVLADEMSASAAEVFAASIQDNARGPLFGWRTMGAGGNVEGWASGSYSLGFITVTESLMNRKAAVNTPEYPSAPYVENIGVRPDIQVDYMTAANLDQKGKPFVDSFIAAMVNHIQSGK